MSDILAMSDEDFLNKLPSMDTSAASSQEGTPPAETEPKQEDTPPAGEEGANADGQVAGEAGAEGAGSGSDRTGASGSEAASGEAASTEGGADTGATGETKSDPVIGTEKAGEADPSKKEGEAAADPTGSKPEGEAANKQVDGGETPIDYEKSFKEIMAPFKANGREIVLKDPSEAIKLMQMGANYTRKMQELAPQRKLLTMLGNNSLLDEAKLSFLIDLDKGDPEAIKKLIKDKGIDPLDIDTSVEPNYREGSHAVGDVEQNFRNQVDELKALPTGLDTLSDINANWDQASKDILWDHPEIMTIIHGQRENGIYAKIVAEVDRQKTLGTIPAETSFLQAYKLAGDALTSSGALKEPESKPAPTQTSEGVAPQREVVGTSTAAPKPKVGAGDKADAASASRANGGKVKEAVNFLAMDDATFLQTMQGRV